MSQIVGLGHDVVGVLLVGAEGCSEIMNEAWVRDATDEERTIFVRHCRSLLLQSKGERTADSFDIASLAIDGCGRPYWLIAILDHVSTPLIAREKATKFTRVMRVQMD